MSHDARVTLLAKADLAAINALQTAAGAPENYLRPKPPEAFARFLSGEAGFAHGVIENGSLVAFALTLLPDEALPGPGMPQAPKRDWPRKVAFLENTVVAPAARGRGYQRLLIRARMEAARQSGRRWACSGVHAANTTSWRNLMREGMAIVGMRLDHGYPIFGLLKPLHGAVVAGERVRMRIALHDAAAHQAALERGLVGAELDGDAVLYAAPARQGRAKGAVVRAEG